MKRKMGALCLIFSFLVGLMAACDAEEGGLTRGVWEGNVYRSAYAGLSFAAPDDFTAATDEEIAELMALSAEDLSEPGTTASEAMLNVQTIYDAIVKNNETQANVILLYDNLNQATAGSQQSETEYLEAVKIQLLGMGIYPYEFGEISGKVLLADQPYAMLEASVPDFSFAQRYYVRKIDDFMFCIVVTAPEASEFDPIVSDFQALP